MTTKVRRGDWVLVTDGPMKGQRGFVRDILRANRDYDRRAEVVIGAWRGIIRYEWLELG